MEQLKPGSVDMSPESVSKAFLEFLNRLPLFQEEFGPDRPIELDDLADGHIMWRICQDVDSEYFCSRLPEDARSNGRWLSRWQNLKHVYRALDRYFIEHNAVVPADIMSIDLKGLAEHGAKEETLKVRLVQQIDRQMDTDISIQLLKMVLLLTYQTGPHLQVYFAPLTTMTEELAMVIMTIVQGFEESKRGFQQPTITDDGEEHPESRSEEKSGSPALLPKPGADLDLYAEELQGQIARLMTEKKDLQREQTDLVSRLERLQENNKALQTQLAEAQDNVKSLSSGPDQASRITELEKRVTDQEEHIAYQENQLEEGTKELENLKVTVYKHQNAGERLQNLQDEVDELRSRNKELGGKASAADKYLKKLQQLQKTNQENDELRERHVDLERQLAASTGTTDERVKTLQLQISEREGLVESIERELSDTHQLKRNAELRVKALEEEMRTVQDQHSRDQETIRELSDADGLRSPRESLGGALENELDGGRQRDVEIESFQAKIKALQGALENNDKQLLAERRERARAEAAYQRLRSGTNLEGSAFSSILSNRISTNRPNSEDDTSPDELEREKAAFSRKAGDVERLSTNATITFADVDANVSQVAMVTNGDLDVVAALKELTQTQEKELFEAKDIISNLQADLDLAKSFHREAVNNQTSDSVGKELRETLDALKSNVSGAKGSTNAPALSAMFENHVQELAKSLEDSQRRVAERTKVNETIQRSKLQEVPLELRMPTPPPPASFIGNRVSRFFGGQS